MGSVNFQQCIQGSYSIKPTNIFTLYLFIYLFRIEPWTFPYTSSIFLLHEIVHIIVLSKELRLIPASSLWYNMFRYGQYLVCGLGMLY